MKNPGRPASALSGRTGLTLVAILAAAVGGFFCVAGGVLGPLVREWYISRRERESLKAALREHERARRPAVTVRVPVADGARVAFLYRNGEVLDRRAANGRVEVRVPSAPD